MGKLKFAMICSSNQNRSMEAHGILQSNGYQVESYGTGAKVKLPGESIDSPNVYDFGTPYAAILKDLRGKSEEFYRKRGLLQMLERNQAIKQAPERWQTSELDFHVAMTFEERVMDAVIADLQERQSGAQPMLIINLDVIDNQDAAAKAAPLVLDLCNKLESADDLYGEMDAVLQAFQIVAKTRILYDVGYY